MTTVQTSTSSLSHRRKARTSAPAVLVSLPYPAGADLASQSIATLNDWHRRAVAYGKAVLPDDVDDDTLTFVCGINNAVLDAVREKTPKTVAEVAAMFEVFIREFDNLKSNSIEEFLNVGDLRRINKGLQQIVREAR